MYDFIMEGKAIGMELKRLSRRRFLKGLAGAGVCAAAPMVIPGRALGADGAVAPSNRITMAAIGVGGMGSGNMNSFLSKGTQVQMVAVCDVDSNHRANAKRRVDEVYGNSDCAEYLDYRDCLGRGDLDAITTATPDHWHALIAVAAAKAGCDIYGEKPLARSIREGRAIADAVHRHGRVWQTGSWQRSVANFRRAVELVMNGRIGKVAGVEVGLPDGGQTGNHPTKPAPANLDWNMWLGPAPWRPYCDFGGQGVHWDWRWILDYSGGQLTDWAGHHIDIAHWGLGMDHTGPVKVEPVNVAYPKEGLWNAPMSYKFNCHYATGEVFTVANARQTDKGMGTKWMGDEGWIHVSRGGFSASDPKILQSKIGPNEIRVYESNDHHQNFLDCVRSRKLTITPPETALRSISVGLLGEIAMLVGRTIRWDPDTEEIIGDPAAAALLTRPYRGPWTL